MTSTPTQVRRPSPNSAWVSSIQHRVAALAAFAALSLFGCTSTSFNSSRFNANVAFMGDSITARWPLPRTNFGVYGNTTTQMLDRFAGEVLGHGYKAVVLLAGTNDMRATGDPLPAEANHAIGNIRQMAALAEQQGLLVVLCTIPPIQGEEYRSVVLNEEIAALAQERGYELVDYYAVLEGHPEDFVDQLHPNDAGYLRMQLALEKVIAPSY